jgi:CBS domain-containing protein
VGSVIVIDRDSSSSSRPVGILTDRDIALAIGTSTNLDGKNSVSDYMTKNILMCSIDDSLFETIDKMKSNGIRRIPVLDNNHNLAGLISADDVLQLLSKELNALSLIINSETEHERNIFYSNSYEKSMTILQ